MTACKISQNGTSTVGTNDHGSCCIAADPGGAVKICKGEPSADVTPRKIARTRSAVPNRFHTMIAPECFPSAAANNSGTARMPVMMSPQPAKNGNGPASLLCDASTKNSTANTRPKLRPIISGVGKFNSAVRTLGQAVAIAAAMSGVTTKIPTIGKGVEIASQPDADAAADSPIH